MKWDMCAMHAGDVEKYKQCQVNKMYYAISFVMILVALAVVYVVVTYVNYWRALSEYKKGKLAVAPEKPKVFDAIGQFFTSS